MRINVVCDDGFKQVIQISKSTIARQLCEDICKIRDRLRIISAQPFECMLCTVDTNEYLSSESEVSKYIVFNENETVSILMSGFKEKELEVVRLYETILKPNQVVVRHESNSSSSSSAPVQKNDTPNPTSTEECCRLIISEIEQSFERGIKLLSSSDARQNARKVSVVKNSLLLTALDALEAKDGAVVLRSLQEFLSVVPSSVASSPKASQNKKRDHETMNASANATLAISNEVSLTQSPVKPTKKQNTNPTPAKQTVPQEPSSIVPVVSSPVPVATAASVAVHSAGASILSTPMESPSKPTTTKTGSMLPSVASPIPVLASQLPLTQDVEGTELFPMTQDSLFDNAMNSVLTSQGIPSINNSQSSSTAKPKKLTAAQKKAAAEAATAAAAESAKAPEVPTAAPIAAVVTGRVTRSNSITSQTSVVSVTNTQSSKATTRQLNKATTAAAVVVPSTPDNKTKSTPKPTPSSIKAVDAVVPTSATSAVSKSHKVKSDSSINADTQLFPITEESSAIDNKSGTDSDKGYDTDDSNNQEETEAEDKNKKIVPPAIAAVKPTQTPIAPATPVATTTSADFRSPVKKTPIVPASPAAEKISTVPSSPIATPAVVVSEVVKAVEVKAVDTKEESSSSDSESGSSSSSSSESESESSSGSESESESSDDSDSEDDKEDANKNVLTKVEDKVVAEPVVAVSAPVVASSVITSVVDDNKKEASGSSSEEESSSSGSESDTEDSDSESDSDISSTKRNLEETFKTPAKPPSAIATTSKTPVPSALKALLTGASKSASCFLPNTPAAQELIALSQSTLVKAQHDYGQSSSGSDHSDVDSDITKLETKKDDSDSDDEDEDGTTPTPIIPASQSTTNKVNGKTAATTPANNKRKASEVVTPSTVKKQTVKPTGIPSKAKADNHHNHNNHNNNAATNNVRSISDSIAEFSKANPTKNVTQSPHNSKVIKVTPKVALDTEVSLTQSSNVTSGRGGAAAAAKKPKIAIVVESNTASNSNARKKPVVK